jgi:predicted helicase
VPAFDLAIADEAHRCAAPHSSQFAVVLDNEKIKARRRLFMTATPRVPEPSVVSEVVNRPKSSRRESRKLPLTCVGLTGFEPATT